MDGIAGERFSVWIYLFINIFSTVTSVHVYGECFHKPSFISSYSPLKANAGPQSEAVTEHGFSEIPIKVEVQVKSAKSSPGAQVVFPGIGSSQRDDDYDSPYGGVVYRYDKTSVYMYVPNRNDGYPAGTVIYTGGSTWVGSITYNETQANVRVRAWKTSDFPKPDFESNWTIIRAQNAYGLNLTVILTPDFLSIHVQEWSNTSIVKTNNLIYINDKSILLNIAVNKQTILYRKTDSYEEVLHGLGMEPEYVMVQVRHGETDMVSEGIGSSMHLSTVNRQTEWGGLIYSYDDHLVRLLVPGFDGVGYVFSAADGWGNNANITVDYGYVKIRAWKLFNGNTTINDRLQYGQSTADVKDYSFGSRKVSLNNGLLSVTTKSPTSNFVFPAMGAVQNSKSRESYGGVVYSYSEIALHLWHPPVNERFDRGYVIYVDNYWGSSVKTERSKSAELQIRAWNAYGNTCPPPTTLPPASTKRPSITTPKFIPSTSMKLLTTTRTTTTSSTTPSTIPTTTKTITSTVLTSTSSSLETTSFTPFTIPTIPLTSKMVTSVGTTSVSSALPTSTPSAHPTVSRSTISMLNSTSVVQLPSSQSNATSVTSSAPLPPVFSGSEGDNGGISSAAVAAIAAVASLVGIGCLSGLLFAVIKRSKERKRKPQVEPEKGEMENNQETTDDKGTVQENNDQKLEEELQSDTAPHDNGILPENNSVIENGQPPANTEIINH